MSKPQIGIEEAGNAIIETINRDLERLMEEMSDGLLVVSEGRIVFANSPLARQLGVSDPHELIGTEVLQWIDPPDHIAWNTHLTGGSEMTELKMIQASGRIVHLELNPARPISLSPNARIVLTHDVTERHRLAQRLLDMTIRERRRIAYDLHDGLGQSLTAVSLQLRLVRQAVDEGRMPEVSDLDGVANLVRDAIEEARRMARGLDVFATFDEGLTAAIRQLAAGAEAIFPITCRVTGDFLELREHERQSSQLYRIAQEAVNNAVRHGDATEVIIDLTCSEGKLRLAITDNGCGIRVPHDSNGMGLRIMHHRAELAGGHLEIAPAPHGGTRVLCVVSVQAGD